MRDGQKRSDIHLIIVYNIQTSGNYTVGSLVNYYYYYSTMKQYCEMRFLTASVYQLATDINLFKPPENNCTF